MFGLSRLWGALAAFGVLLGGMALWTLKAFSAGRRAERQAQTEQALKHASKAGEIDEDVARLSDDELDRELRGPGRK